MLEMDRLSELKEIMIIIETLREKLNKMSENIALTDPEIVAASRMFDALLNEYQRIIKEKENRSNDGKIKK